jgi:hypothetical protein
MRSHPEIKGVMAAFTKAVLREKPDDIKAFAATWFDSDQLQARVDAETIQCPA